jgi:cell division protein FtsZ
MSLFGGRRRHEESYPEVRDLRATAPIPQARSTGSAQPVQDEQVDEGEDLEIPSFLRRLAN